jgi:hypothetical protein
MSATNKHPSRPKGQKRQALRHEVVLASPLALLSSPPPHLRPRRLSLSLSLISSTMQAISRAFPFPSPSSSSPRSLCLGLFSSGPQANASGETNKRQRARLSACRRPYQEFGIKRIDVTEQERRWPGPGWLAGWPVREEKRRSRDACTQHGKLRDSLLLPPLEGNRVIYTGDACTRTWGHTGGFVCLFVC